MRVLTSPEGDGMPLRVTLIVESTEHSGGENRMEKTVEAGSDNERFYPSQVEHVGVELITWAYATMVNLVGGKDRTLVDHDAKMMVNQRAHLAAMEQAQKFADFKKANGDQVLVSRDSLDLLRRRDARLTAMEAAGVDNWEGMDHVEFPED